MAGRTLLRPPGALAEEEFLATCYRCGSCAESCPADAIWLLPQGPNPKAGTPCIDANLAACVVCEGLQCTQVCPSGALRRLEDPSQIRMGLARVLADDCVRTAGQDCTICVDRCPLGSSALRLGEADLPEVLSDGCVGCGICQLYCPTTPKAIVVEPL